MGAHFQEIDSFPTGSFTDGSTNDFGALLSAQEVESQAAQDGQVMLCRLSQMSVGREFTSVYERLRVV